MEDSLSALDITVEKCERADLVFWRAHSTTLMSVMFETVLGRWGRNTRCVSVAQSVASLR